MPVSPSSVPLPASSLSGGCYRQIHSALDGYLLCTQSHAMFIPARTMYQSCNVHLTLGVRRPHAQSDSCQQLCSFVFDIRPDSSCKAVYPRGPCMYHSTVTSSSEPIVVVPPCTATYLFTDAPRPVSAHVKWHATSVLLARRWNGQTGVKSVCRLLWKSFIYKAKRHCGQPW